MSEHNVLVLTVKTVNPTANADRLDTLTVGLDGVHGDWQTVVPRGVYAENDLVVFVEPDYEVPNTPPFAHLFKGKEGLEFVRIKACRLRGTYSAGLAIPAEPGMRDGQDVMKRYGIRKWVSRGDKLKSGDECRVPAILRVGKYDMENTKHRTQAPMLSGGVEVIATEKIHGANWRAACIDGEIYVGSRNRWLRRPGKYTVQVKRKPKTLWEKFKALLGFKLPPETITQEASDSLFWRGLTPEIEACLRLHPNHVFYGELYGEPVQGSRFAYDAKPGAVKVRIFDAVNLEVRQWWGSAKLRDVLRGLQVPLVPVLYVGPYNEELLLEMIEGDSALKTGAVCEGVVVKHNNWLGCGSDRLCAKMVSIRYLGKS